MGRKRTPGGRWLLVAVALFAGGSVFWSFPFETAQFLRRPVATWRLAAWAGTYYRGDGLGLNWLLELSPWGRYHFTWDTCQGTFKNLRGVLHWEDDVLKVGGDDLLPARSRWSGGILGRGASTTRDAGLSALDRLREILSEPPWHPPGMVPVRWGQRRYLVLKSEGLEFCNLVSRGLEPRTIAHGEVLLAVGDWNLPAPGLPEVPLAWTKYLLTRAEPEPRRLEPEAEHPENRLEL
jgi:hypothetical protein